MTAAAVVDLFLLMAVFFPCKVCIFLFWYLIVPLTPSATAGGMRSSTELSVFDNVQVATVMTARMKASTVMRTFEERVILQAHRQQTVVLELEARVMRTRTRERESVCVCALALFDT